LPQDFHPLGLFKDKHSKELNFPTLFYGQPWQNFQGFSYQQIAQWESLQKFGIFQQIFLTFFFKATKFSIQKIISFGWLPIQKGKLCGRISKAYKVRDKPKLNTLFKSYLGYCDLEGLHNSFDYFERL
jgi:hypothetical protein